MCSAVALQWRGNARKLQLLRYSPTAGSTQKCQLRPRSAQSHWVASRHLGCAFGRRIGRSQTFGVLAVNEGVAVKQENAAEGVYAPLFRTIFAIIEDDHGIPATWGSVRCTSERSWSPIPGNDIWARTADVIRVPLNHWHGSLTVSGSCVHDAHRATHGAF